MTKKRFNIHDYIDYGIAAIFIITILAMIAIVFAIGIGIPWLIDIVEKLVEL